MRVKKLLKVGGIILASLLVIGLLSVVTFVFNPFEGKVNDLRDVVPRTVDFFLRKEALREDFQVFPKPAFWESFERTSAWQKIRVGPTYRGLQRQHDLERVLADVREGVERLSRDTPIDLLRDLLGNEIEVAGTLKAPLEASTWCLYARVSWRTKAAFGLSGYGFVQDQARGQGIELSADGELLKIAPRGAPKPMWAARHLDCVVLGNDKDLVDKSLRLAKGESDLDALGGSSDYRDGVDARLRAFESVANMTGRANALEYYLRPEQLFAVTGWDKKWPDANHPESMNQRVLAAFVNLAGWRFASGALVFERDSLAVLARIMLNQNEHTPFQSEFFRTEAQKRSEWLDSFLASVPDDACACAAMRMPAGPFLRQMYRALDKDVRELFDEGVKRTGAYKTSEELLSQLELALLPRTGFVFRKNTPDREIVVKNPEPLPQIAWVFWLKPIGGKAIVDKFLKVVFDHHRTIFQGPAYKLDIEGRADKILECTNPDIPGTGSLAFLLYDQFLILANSGPLIRSMIAARDGRVDSVMAQREMRAGLKEMSPSINGLVYVRGPELERVLDSITEYIDKASVELDTDFATTFRSEAESKVLRAKYSQFGSQAGLPPNLREQFKADVIAELKAMWAKQQGAYSAEDKATVAELTGWCRTFSSAYLQVVLDPQSIQVQGRIILDWK
jgi:hypothetical protein